MSGIQCVDVSEKPNQAATKVDSSGSVARDSCFGDKIRLWKKVKTCLKVREFLKISYICLSIDLLNKFVTFQF